MYNKILLPIANKKACQRALKAAQKAAVLCDGEILLLHVEGESSSLIGGAAHRELLKEHDADSLKTLEPIISFLEEKGIKHRIVFGNGVIADTIVRVAAEENVDAIVMFTDGVQTISEMVFGSITQQVLCDIDCDLVSVRR